FLILVCFFVTRFLTAAATASAASSITDLVIRLSETSPIEGYMAISLSATYHCTAAVPATVLIITLGTREGIARRIEQTRLVPFAPPSPMAPAISPFKNCSISILLPPSIITVAASWRDCSFSICHDAPAAETTLAPVISAPPTLCVFKDKSMIHGVTPACASACATKRASLLLVFIVARTATVGLDLLTTASPAVLRY